MTIISSKDEQDKVLLERTALTASLSALRVGASIERRPFTLLHLIGTVGTVIWCVILIADLELRLVDGHDCELVLVPIFLALVLVLMGDCTELGRDAAETERVVFSEAVGSDPMMMSEMMNLLLAQLVEEHILSQEDSTLFGQSCERELFSHFLGDDLRRLLLDFESCVDDWRNLCRWLNNHVCRNIMLHPSLFVQALIVSQLISSGSFKSFVLIFWCNNDLIAFVDGLVFFSVIIFDYAIAGGTIG